MEVTVRTGAVESRPVSIDHLVALQMIDNEQFKYLPPRKQGEPYAVLLKGVKAEPTSKAHVTLLAKGAVVGDSKTDIRSV